VIVLTLAALLPLQALAAGLPAAAKPEDVGLSSARLAVLERTLRAEIEQGRIPAPWCWWRARAAWPTSRRSVCAIRTAGRDDAGRDLRAGLHDEADGVGRGHDALRGRAAPTATIRSSKYLPAMGKMQVGVERVPVEREMTIQDLLRHTPGSPTTTAAPRRSQLD